MSAHDDAIQAVVDLGTHRAVAAELIDAYLMALDPSVVIDGQVVALLDISADRFPDFMLMRLLDAVQGILDATRGGGSAVSEPIEIRWCPAHYSVRINEDDGCESVLALQVKPSRGDPCRTVDLLAFPRDRVHTQATFEDRGGHEYEESWGFPGPRRRYVTQWEPS